MQIPKKGTSSSRRSRPKSHAASARRAAEKQLYDRSLTAAAIAAAKLTPRCQQFVDLWLAGWEGGELPASDAWPATRFKKLRTLVMSASIGPDATRKVTHFGTDLPRIMRAKLLGVDWMALVPKKDKAERLRRSSTIADGTIFKTVRNVQLSTGGTYRFETVSVPFRKDPAGNAVVATFFDWNPPNRKSTMTSLDEIIRSPERAEFISMAKAPLLAPRDQMPPEHVKIISRAAVRMILSFTADMLKGAASARLDPLDYLIALAIGRANVAHIEDDTAVSRRYASDIEPAWMRRGVSRAAIARTTSIPLETVRRRVNKLIGSKVLLERSDGLVLSPDDPFQLSARGDALASTAVLVQDMFREIRAKGVRLDSAIPDA